MPETTDSRSDTRRAVTIGAVVAASLFVAVLFFAWASSGDVSAASSEDVLVMLVCENEDGVAGARVVTAIGSDRNKPQVISPDLEVTLAGTDYATLFDAYAFGGPDAVADAYAAATDAGRPSYVAIRLEEVVELAGDGTVDVTLPSVVDVFTGEELLSFGPGETAVAWAEVDSLLDGADYESSEVQYDVHVRVGEDLIGVLVDYGPMLDEAVEAGRIRSDDVDRVMSALRDTDA